MSTYEGWKNRETWCVSLWIGNEEWMYDEAIRLTHQANEPAELAYMLKDFIECLPDVEAVTEQASFASDLLTGALGRVDWREIADHYWADFAAEEKEQEEEATADA